MLKILLVDDEMTERKGLKFLIAKYQFPLEIHEASNGKAALDYIRENPVDILLTDVKMPFMDGLELAGAVHAGYEKIKIIIFSAYSEFEYARKALEVKALHYLLKPVEVDEFRTVMEQVIAMCEQERDQERESRIYDREQLLYQLVTAPEIQEDCGAALEEHGISFKGCELVLINMETRSNFFDKHEAEVPELLESCVRVPHAYINVSSGSSYAVLYSISAPGEQELTRSCRRLREEILRGTGVELSLVISSPFRELRQFPEKVQEMEAVRAELFYRPDDLLFTDSLRHVREVGPAATDHIMARVESAAENKDVTEVKRLIGELVEELKKQEALSAIYTRYLFWDILKNLYKKFQVQNDAFFNRMVEALLQCDSLEGLERLVEELVDGLSVQSPENALDSPAVVESVLRIIRTEYQKDLNLEYLSQRVFLAPAYLSYLFKQQTGENIIPYLTSFRMEKAKKLLQDGNMKIVDICRACGYDNASYFNRLFKNSFGVTPRQFRESKHG